MKVILEMKIIQKSKNESLNHLLYLYLTHGMNFFLMNFFL